ncbi:3-hydroxybutyrate dehydrogenase [Thioclava sp.]|uniref:3-hydroxybutyrate dehydrogenase n=1 Tax=Thioclava sp. TaxID=1933450 RepID=UPI003AA98FA2
MSLDLKDKICIITGSASGIGKAIATRYVADGAKVVIADLDLSKAQETADALTKQGPGSAMGIKMDVTDENAVNSGVKEVVEKWGSVDVLVSNAGIQIVHPIEDFPFKDWKKLLAIHLDGGFLTSKAVIPYMKKQGSGSIIFMGSVHSKEASPLKSAYVTAKHGLLGLARVISKEGGKYGVRANVICPGFVKTPLVEKQIPEQAKDLGISEEKVVSDIMLGGTVDTEFTTVEDVAEVAYLFAAFPTNALTGQSLVVSHGWYMN